ncbi:MAG: sigma-70 family RNA polymerase sigma factor [Isosphaeraceae bacterium]
MNTPRADEPEPSGLTSPSLLLRVRDPADSEAWRIFIETYTPLVFGYMRRRGLQASDAADVTQEVMAQVSRSIRTFSYEPERGRFRHWLGTVARTKLLRHLRNSARGGKPGEAAAEEMLRHVEAPESDTLWSEEFEARVLEVAMERVRPEFQETTWRVFERSWIAGLSVAEVAEECGVPVGTVYVSRSRVLKRLREEVVALAEDFPQRFNTRD